MERDLHIETLLAHHGEERQKHQGAVVPPIYQNSLFTFSNWDAIDRAFDDRIDTPIYSRGHNPSVAVTEEKIALLAGGERARLFPSGMAAITAAVLHCVHARDHVVAVGSIYGPAANLLDVYLREKLGLETTFVSGEDAADFEAASRENTRLIYLESPSSAVFSLQDVRAVATWAGSRGIPTILDNSWATPIFQRPLAMGVDLEVHSCSKYLGGHSDLVSGAVIGREDEIRSIAEESELLGGKMAPWEAWLLLRSLRTLPIRMLRHQESAQKVARFLESHPSVRLVRYPGLESFPQRDLALRQMSGFSGLMGFVLDAEDIERIKAFVDALSIFRIGVSWGGHESLVYAPAISYLKELTPEQFRRRGISLSDIRISVGLEHPDDLIRDLDQALRQLRG